MSAGMQRPRPAKPRLAFLGVGWIGRHRMEAVAQSGVADIRAVSDPCADSAEAARSLSPGCEIADSLETMLDQGVDGLVIATPSALHAEQAMRALERGVAVFCQKPLGRNADEVAPIIDAARKANRLLDVDFSYRHTRAMKAIRPLIQQGDLGRVYAVDLVFHNAYGPDKPWFYDPRLSGGGCVMDLGIHLVDLALWTLGFPEVAHVSGQLLANGLPVESPETQVEDYASATLTLRDGCSIRLACSWRLQAGCDAVIEASFYGTKGGASFRNVSGSFYDFIAEHFVGTSRHRLVDPPDPWGGRGVVDWAIRLARGEGFDPQVEHVIQVSRILDAIRNTAFSQSDRPGDSGLERVASRSMSPTPPDSSTSESFPSEHDPELFPAHNPNHR